MSFLLATIGILVAFGSVIFIHEFGHFIVAKKSGIKVEQFSFGFGKEIFGFNWGETRYTVNWIPLGGYVRMAGEVPEEYEGPVLEGGDKKQDETDHSRDFMAQPWYQRILVALAGPVMNYVFAVVLFFSLFVIFGEPVYTNQTEIGEVRIAMPAEKAGLQSGDVILAVNGKEVEDFLDIKTIVSPLGGQKVTLGILRNEKERTVTVTPRWNDSKSEALIGITQAPAKIDRQDIGVFDSLKGSVRQCWFISTLTLSHLGQKIKSGEKPDVAGPIGIGQIIAKAVKSGFEEYISLIAFISVAIGLFNLFPIPLLDGGHVVYYLIEGIRGKPLSVNVIGKANFVGLALLLCLLVFATFNDIMRNRKSPEKPAAVEAK